MENVIYYHQEHVCNSFFDGVGKFLKMASFGVSEQFWCPGGPKITPDATKMMNFEHQRVAKSLKRVYQLINNHTCVYMCCLLLKIMTKSVLWHLLATFFGENKKKCETKGFCHQFFVQYTPNNVY